MTRRWSSPAVLALFSLSVTAASCTSRAPVDPVDAGSLDSGARGDAPLPAADGPMVDALGYDAPRGDGAARPDTPGAGCPEGDLGAAVGPALASGTTAGSTIMVAAGCAAGEPSPSRRFLWRAPHAGTFGIDTFGSSFDTALVVYAGGCAGPEVDCSDDAGDDAQSQVILEVAAGDVFVVVVTGYDAAESGAFVLNVAEAAATAEIGLCHNGSDDDLDGAADCLDDDCWDEPSCTETECQNGLDDDGDGDADCWDFDCYGVPACTETMCRNGLDDDGDLDVDCDDLDCWDAPGCFEAACGDGLDDDGDGDVDCLDVDCDGVAPCIEADCGNGLDDEGDGWTDCLDYDCDGVPPCIELVCGDGLDDEGDGLTDCLDPDCASDGACLP